MVMFESQGSAGVGRMARVVSLHPHGSLCCVTTMSFDNRKLCSSSGSCSSLEPPCLCWPKIFTINLKIMNVCTTLLFKITLIILQQL